MQNPTVSEEAREAIRIAEESELGMRDITGPGGKIVPILAGAWSIFQLSISSFIIVSSVYVRAIHLAFALSLVYFSYPLFRKPKKSKFLSGLPFLWSKKTLPVTDIIPAVIAVFASMYMVFDYSGLSSRQGMLISRDVIAGCILVVLVLEAARRSLGPVLTFTSLVFILYAFLGPYMPGVLAYKGVSLYRFIGQITASTEGIYGIPLDVSATIVFLFVLFGSMLDKAGAGKYFVELAFSLLGRFRGGPAKAAVLSSAFTGMVSGSSIANVVTTGTFTIPMMKSVGYPAHKAGAIEVASSTNGQLMPPVMGAAAFIIAEFCNIKYFDVVRAAFIPAVISYLALGYIVHIEACKLGLRGLARSEIPSFIKTLLSGIHFLIPIMILIYELVIARHSPQLSVFRAITALLTIIILQNLGSAYNKKETLLSAVKKSLRQIIESLIAGGRNMMGIGVAVAAAGIIVGVVSMGLGGIITEIIEVISGGNFALILIITAVACLLLGMGLPTTANYIVMASLTAPVIVVLGAKAGVVFPLVAAHLFVFFFGILADDTPPVGLAAFAASAIAKSDPIKTGIQGFTYDLRTAILPFMFIFNTDLLLIHVHSWHEIAWVFTTALCAMFAFASFTQNFIVVKNRWYESLLLILSAFMLLRPYFSTAILGLPEGMHTAVEITGLCLYALVWILQKQRARVHGSA